MNNSNFTTYFSTLVLKDGLKTTLGSFLKIVLINELNAFCTFVFHAQQKCQIHECNSDRCPRPKTRRLHSFEFQIKMENAKKPGCSHVG